MTCTDDATSWTYSTTFVDADGDTAAVPTVEMIVSSFVAGSITDRAGNALDTSLASTTLFSTSKDVVVDTVHPTVAIEQAITETIGSCSFTAQVEEVSLAELPIEFKVTFLSQNRYWFIYNC